MGKNLSQINIGDEAYFSKTISESDIYGFSGIVGDFNPIHVNKEYAKKTIFKERIAPGILVIGLISTVIANKLPGEGTIYLSQDSKFLKPVYVGDTITAIVKVVEKIESKNRVILNTKCINQQGDMVIKGTSIVMPPKTLET